MKEGRRKRLHSIKHNKTTYCMSLFMLMSKGQFRETENRAFYCPGMGLGMETKCKWAQANFRGVMARNIIKQDFTIL